MSRKLRITFVLNGGGLSGGQRIIVGHANRLLDRGHDVRIVVLRWPLIWRPRALWYECCSRASFRLRLSHEHLHDFRGEVLCIPLSKLNVRIPDADIVLATHWMTAEPVAALPVSKGAKFYFLQHYEIHVFDKQLVDATWRLPMRKIVIARWLQDLARDEFGDDRSVLVPNGVDTDLFHAPPRAMQKPPCVGVMYSTEPWKCTGLAFEVAELVRRNIPDLEVVCFGEQKPHPGIPLPARTRYIHQPPQQTIRDIYASADVWLCPSRTEGFALPPLEAMACRCPVVCTRCGGPEDFVEDGKNGFLTPVDDADAMQEGVKRILSDPNRWQQMSEAALATSRRFNWEHSTSLFESALLN